MMKHNIGTLGVQDVGQLVGISGTVIRSGSVRSLAKSKTFVCCVCGLEFTLKAEVCQYHLFELPPKCSKRCKSNTFAEVPGTEDWRDYREIKLQEPFSGVSSGRMPPAIWVLLSGNIVQACTPGDDVTVVGQALTRWKPVFRDRECELQLIIYASSLTVHSNKLFAQVDSWTPPEGDEFMRRKVLISSFAPQIFGYPEVKLGMILCMLGGVRSTLQGVSLRGHCHALLIGEAGTGKSTLLKRASEVEQRGVYTNAMGASKAGLSLFATKENGEWMLEAGVLVLADYGLCCLDDFNALNKDEFHEIYEAMEHQSISVAKAGMVCTVNTRTTVFCALRPALTSYDPNRDLRDNTGLPPPLLSRFDLIFALLDNAERDQDKVNTIVRTAYHSVAAEEKLKSFISYAKKSAPELSPECAELLSKYYDLLRKDSDSSMTMRQLESLLRLARAHAKLCGRETVTLFDAVSTILTYENSCRGVGSLTSMPPEAWLYDWDSYCQAEQEVLSHLGTPEESFIDDSVLW